MNEPLKHKLFSVYGLLLKEETLRKAWKKVKENKGCAGVDKVSISRFERDEEENISQILSELKSKEYKASPVQRKYIQKKNGKKRPLGIPTIKDRIVQQALKMKLEPFFEENVFHDNSCGFRPERGAELVLKKIITRLDNGYHYVYDFDIKSYFDKIPHKKLMKVINKYVSDGTVLDMIWKWLKAGYMVDGEARETESGAPQGAVISPLLSNIYLNELDWELDKEGFQFIRYADDGVVMCKTKEELERAKKTVKRVLEELGLEIAEDKTKDIDFHDEDFDFIGFSFKHIRTGKKGNSYYVLAVSDGKLKEFKNDIKSKIKKTNTFSFEKWKEILNPFLRGKFNYMLLANKAIQEVRNKYKEQNKGMVCRAYFDHQFISKIDSKVRQRLRVSFANRGKKSARYNDGKMLTVKYPNTFFIKVMGITTGHFLLYKSLDKEITIEEYITKLENKPKRKRIHNKERRVFFEYAYTK